MKGLPDSVKIVNYQGGIAEIAPLENTYFKAPLSITCDNNIIFDSGVSKREDFGTIAVAIKGKGRGNGKSASNVQTIELGTGTIKFKHTVIQYCAIPKCQLMIVIRQITCGTHVVRCRFAGLNL